MRYIAVCVLSVLLCFSSNTAFAFTITSPFGYREHPISGEEKFHTGIDLAEEYDTPIGAVWEGVVVFVGSYGGYGNTVLLQHNEQTYTLYAHCNQLLVSVGQAVQQGQVISTVGSTGNSTGPHLHLELWQNGQYVDPMIIWSQ